MYVCGSVFCIAPFNDDTNHHAPPPLHQLYCSLCRCSSQGLLLAMCLPSLEESSMPQSSQRTSSQVVLLSCDCHMTTAGHACNQLLLITSCFSMLITSCIAHFLFL